MVSEISSTMVGVVCSDRRASMRAVLVGFMDDDIRETLMWGAHQRFLLFSGYDIEQCTSGGDGCDDCVIASHH